MNTFIEISEDVEVRLKDFNSSVDLGIYFKDQRGQWINTGAVVLPEKQSIALALCLINATPRAIEILKPKFLNEDNKDNLKSRPKRSPPQKPKKTLFETMSGINHSLEGS
jgi:hypothetical protein